MSKVAILQSNYIPWRGYFDLIAAVDEFILYDDVQFTKNDWRNRNKIKTPKGLEWITVPVGQDIRRQIREVELPKNNWAQKHWRTLEANYCRTTYFEDVATLLKPIYLEQVFPTLSELNRALIEGICEFIGIRTKISWSWDYDTISGKTDRLIDLCRQVNGYEYVSGPSAQSYLDQEAFESQGIQVTWFNYDGFPDYPQLWGDFTPQVSILDLLFNCGREARNYMRNVRS